MLALATLGFTLTFWAWALLGPLGPDLRDRLDLSVNQQAIVVAVPVIVGSIGRIPVGALTDRLGARIMFPAVSLLTIVPVLYLGHVADSYVQLLVGGFFLGLGGTTFAIGIPFVNAWYPPSSRGTALGIFGAGMGGTAIAAFTTVPLADNVGQSFPFTLVAVILAVYAMVAWLMLRDWPGRTVSTASLLSRTVGTLKIPATIPLALLYAVAFGGFVAFSVYLPTYLKNAFELSQSDASFRTAGFVLVAVVMRPVGGYLSDRFGAVTVLSGVFGASAVLALLASFEFDLVPVGTVAFLGLAAALGAGAGAVFALVAEMVPGERVGAVTGFVGAAGGLGGFFPPLVMGAFYSSLDSYTWGFVLLALTAAAAFTYTTTAVRRQVREHQARCE
ncbi:MFS transporter [Phytoactinopolyspora halotolerans]|uniref:NarK/NasA family nitrate transporter n=1 Tax=Phytoactinopolyspora halotolerans TaxID=1981512 RepID=A0A6L9S7A5_9ACTN|nr:NarK/NasA family nitrate transporter [Phytoactinopolyspora halotolerans]